MPPKGKEKEKQRRIKSAKQMTCSWLNYKFYQSEILNPVLKAEMVFASWTWAPTTREQSTSWRLRLPLYFPKEFTAVIQS